MSAVAGGGAHEREHERAREREREKKVERTRKGESVSVRPCRPKLAGGSSSPAASAMLRDLLHVRTRNTPVCLQPVRVVVRARLPLGPG